MNIWMSWALENIPPELIGAALTTLIGFVTIKYLEGIRRRRFLKGAAEMLACKLIDVERICEELGSDRVTDERVIQIAENPTYRAVLFSLLSDIQSWNARSHEFIESSLIVRLSALDHMLNLCEINVRLHIEYLQNMLLESHRDKLLRERKTLLDMHDAYDFRKVSEASRLAMAEVFRLGMGLGMYRTAIRLLGELSQQSLDELSVAN